MINQYEYDIRETDGTVTCYYTSTTGVTFSALAVIAEYSDLDSAKSAAMSLAVQNGKNFNEIVSKTNGQ